MRIPFTTLEIKRSAASVKTRAAPLPAIKRDAGIADILPPFNTNPPSTPLVSGGASLESRWITEDPRSLWYLALPSKMTPSQVLQILRSALGGDIWQQWQLLTLMWDSWPMFRKCSHELSEAVAYTKFKARPYVENEGDEPSDDAKERADLVNRAMKAFKPNPFNDEKGFTGMVYNFTDAVFNGIMMEEIVWYKTRNLKRQPEWMPRAAAWVHPRHFTFSDDGQIVIFDKDYNRMYSPLADRQHSNSPMPDKFLCAQFMSKSGSSLGAGLMRPLAKYWSAVVFNFESMMVTSQKYGAPFLDVAVKGGLDPNELAKIDAEIQAAQSNRWMRHREEALITIHPPTSMGPDNPQVHLMKLCDDACMYLLLGQEATTKSTPGKLGGEDTKDKVKRERVEGIANWIASEPMKQFARAVLRRNYGNDDLCPEIEADFTEETDPLKQAQITAVYMAGGLPIQADEIYGDNNLTVPEEGDLVFVDGKLGTMGSTDEIIEPTGPPAPEPGMDEQGQPIKINQARKFDRSVNQLLAKASSDELEQVNVLASKAASAPHANGELQELEMYLSRLHRRYGE